MNSVVILITMALPDKKISQKILKDHYNALVFRKGRGHVYLVGGFIRDMVRDKRSHDRDYIVFGDIRSFVKQIRTSTGGAVVEFKNEGVIRIALKGGDTLDFSKPQGTLEEDLSKRDFTVNAIAWSPQGGFVDLCNGADDIEIKKVRSLSRENFIADPLRMLRAYRIATELDASIEKRTRLMIKSLQNTMQKVSYERITLEFFRLLNSSHSTKYLKMALSDGVLTDILSIDYNILERTIRAVSHLEKTYINILPRVLKVSLNRTFSQNLTYKGLLCLEMFLSDGFSPDKTASLLVMSKAIHKRILMAQKGMTALREKRNIDKESLFDMFIATKDAAIDVLILSNRMDLLPDYRRFLRIRKNGFVNSQEIADISGMKPGARLGGTILTIKKAQFTRKVISKRQALSLIKAIAAAEDNPKSQKSLCSGDN
jgi:tRNA nucleotidyltransferase/poly(A) polymerase